MSKKDSLTKKTANAREKMGESSAFACEQCNKMYIFEDALAAGMTCCGESLKQLIPETSTQQ